MEKRWEIYPKISEDLKIQLLANRNITDKGSQEDFLQTHLNLLSDPEKLFPELPKVIKRIKKARVDKELIYIYGDFDVDGISASAILWETLNGLGAKVLPYIPERHTEGYGLHNEALAKLAAAGAKLIISVDCGITALEQTRYAKKLGLDLVITDHHQPQESLPKAFAILHTTGLSGSGVAFKLANALLAEFGGNDEQFFRNLELATLGTVADMVPLVGENRVIVKNGLRALGKTERLGLRSLYDEAELSKNIGTAEIGFIISPRLNAMGRMESALDSLRLLLTNNPDRARKLALKLGETNRGRQESTRQAFEHAKQEVEKNYNEAKLFVVSSAEYEQGVVGLVAGRIAEAFHRPTAVISEVSPVSKGSARSISGFNINEAIHTHAELLTAHGGHPMAAGFSIAQVNIPAFRERLTKTAEQLLKPAHLVPTLKIDAEITADQINQELLDVVREFEPFGIGNLEPTFLLKNVEVVESRMVGKDGKHLKLVLRVQGRALSAIGFGLGSRELPKGTVDVVFTISENTWQSKKTIELKIKDLKES
ncbi:MAG: single-stranded-DNA-specific exonuclease RecJ [Candidatus Woykebacteria bacterium RIFCSPHIGHO2_12_FULL_45_10]|uniref:Single-stranded-DNA-specific exonuclease RecJ n=1 Tax=Candidatus Woykebacteria bacterium RIFCSPHIGHO2_12_FULL_45_10 TaxID=1802603 RepID=A0A1G1WRV2_9BACT|nr:MAG: single-stranded-DNA-specific exonuclease RecJ [Candidatus Woykebacteria bacterium RIFCSPHIGHO2_12_FULL_45_10]